MTKIIPVTQSWMPYNPHDPDFLRLDAHCRLSQYRAALRRRFLKLLGATSIAILLGWSVCTFLLLSH